MSPTTPQALPPASAVDYVRSLSPEEKQAVFLELLREAMRSYGDMGLLPIDDEDGRPFGYYVPPRAAMQLFEKQGPKLTEEEEAEIDRRVESLGPAIPLTKVIADLKEQMAQLQQQPQ